MTMDVIYEEHGSDWSHQVSAVGTTQWLPHNQTLPLSAKGVACETNFFKECGMQSPPCGCQACETTQGQKVYLTNVLASS